MPKGKTVRPQKWGEILNLYDDDENSAIWGRYDDDEHRCLGVRWNGNGSEVGYPNQGNNPLWYAEPYFVTKNILLELFYTVNNDPSKGNLENILKALKECSQLPIARNN